MSQEESREPEKLSYLDVRLPAADGYQLATRFLVSHGPHATEYNAQTAQYFTAVKFHPRSLTAKKPEPLKAVVGDKDVRNVTYVQPPAWLVHTDLESIVGAESEKSYTKGKKPGKPNDPQCKSSAAACHLTYVTGMMKRTGLKGFKDYGEWQKVVTPTCWTKHGTNCVTSVFFAKIVKANTDVTADTYILPDYSNSDAQQTESAPTNTTSRRRKAPAASGLQPSAKRTRPSGSGARDSGMETTVPPSFLYPVREGSEQALKPSELDSSGRSPGAYGSRASFAPYPWNAAHTVASQTLANANPGSTGARDNRDSSFAQTEENARHYLGSEEDASGSDDYD